MDLDLPTFAPTLRWPQQTPFPPWCPHSIFHVGSSQGQLGWGYSPDLNPQVLPTPLGTKSKSLLWPHVLGGLAPPPAQIARATFPPPSLPCLSGPGFLKASCGPSFLPAEDHHVCSPLCQKHPLRNTTSASNTLPSTLYLVTPSRTTSPTHHLGHIHLLGLRGPP